MRTASSCKPPGTCDIAANDPNRVLSLPCGRGSVLLRAFRGFLPALVVFGVAMLCGVARAQEASSEPFEGVPQAVPGGYTEALLFYVFAGGVVLSALGV
ncbi:MAG: hypothetical protein IID38_04875, partial [Planctomycetes bacterium]|nr:hypothetical protein [Planctomycetota bacterium]